MSEDLKIPVTTPGAPQAAQQLANVAEGERRVGREGKEGGEKVADGARKGRQGIDQLGGALGVNVRAFQSWQFGVVAAIAGAVKGLGAALDKLKEINEEVRQNAQTGAAAMGSPGIRALADIRGATQQATLLHTLRAAQRFDVTQQTAEQAFFGIESGLDPGAIQGGAAGVRKIEEAALQTAAVTGASGETVAGLAITAQEALGATKPEEFKRFFAQSTAAARASRVSLSELGGILNETLPLAVKAGIDPEQFMARAAVMSFRVRQPQMVRTALRQMIAAAGRPSDELTKLAAQGGQDLRRMSATEIMELQSSMLEQAATQGPQAAGAVATALGLPIEVAQIYMQTTDKASKLRQQALAETVRGAAYGGTIGGRFAALETDPFRRIRGAKIGEQIAEIMETARSGERLAMEAEAAAEATGQPETRAAEVWQGAVRGIPLVGKALAGEDIKLQMARSIAMQKAKHQLEQIAGATMYPEEMRARARQAAEALDEGAGAAAYQVFGTGDTNAQMQAVGALLTEARRFEQERSQAAQVFNGGTHYHLGEKRDPAGRPRTPAGAR